MHSNKSAEFSGVKDHFEDLLQKVFDEAMKEPKITVVIVQLSLVITMLETEKFCSQSFYDTTETKDHCGSLEEAAEERVLQAIDSFICVESQKLCIESLLEVHGCISASDTKRKCILLYEDVVDRAKRMNYGVYVRVSRPLLLN
jgi:hypothetical protein